MPRDIYIQQLREYMDVQVIRDFRGRSFLITGATGLLGSVLVDLLLAANDALASGMQVCAMGRSAAHGQERFAAYWGRADFTFLAQDVTLPLSGERHFDYIIHAAGNSHPQLLAADPVGTMTGNFLGIYQLLEYARRMKAGRVLYVSSGEVYGELDKPVKAENDYGYVDVLNARSGYPNSKRAAETLCVAYSQQYDVDTVMVRPSHLYGPTMTRQDSHAVAEFLRHAAAGEDIVMRSTGAVVRSYTYVLDAASAILLVLLRGERAKAYNVAEDRKCISIKEIAEYLAKLGGVKLVLDLPVDYAGRGYGTITRQVLDSSRLHALGWECRQDVYQGLKNTLKILRKGNL